MSQDEYCLWNSSIRSFLQNMYIERWFTSQHRSLNWVTLKCLQCSVLVNAILYVSGNNKVYKMQNGPNTHSNKTNSTHHDGDSCHMLHLQMICYAEQRIGVREKERCIGYCFVLRLMTWSLHNNVCVMQKEKLLKVIWMQNAAIVLCSSQKVCHTS